MFDVMFLCVVVTVLGVVVVVVVVRGVVMVVCGVEMVCGVMVVCDVRGVIVCEADFCGDSFFVFFEGGGEGGDDDVEGDDGVGIDLDRCLFFTGDWGTSLSFAFRYPCICLIQIISPT